MPENADDSAEAFSAFEKNFKAGKTQLLFEWLPADLETPVGAYLKVCGTEPHCCLFESIEGGERLGRYSIIGAQADYFWCFNNGKVRERLPDGVWGDVKGDPLTLLRQSIKDCHIDVVPDDLPPMAVSGLFGYLGYDMIRLYEDIPDNNPDTLDIPESVLMRPRVLIVFDNVKNMMCLVTTVLEHHKNCEDSVKDIFYQARSRLLDIKYELSQPVPAEQLDYKTALSEQIEPQSNLTRAQYHDMVEKAVEYIKAGDIFQVVPSQRMSVDFDLPSIALYRSLRRLNPSPFMFHITFDGFSLVGSSPELLVRLRDSTVTIRPIAGTRKRGANHEEDLAQAKDLLDDPKECAEHLMLLDLGRNDVGRVAEIGSMNVSEQFIIEYYSHVMHIVSNVEGKLRKDCDAIDALFSGFPAGTVSGAPKIRAMEIIDELESEKRSFYGGCIGYFSGNGEMDNCIALRTGLIKDNKLYVQAGGGVVADSDPEYEYQESNNKAQALIKAARNAIEMANSGQNLFQVQNQKD